MDVAGPHSQAGGSASRLTRRLIGSLVVVALALGLGALNAAVLVGDVHLRLSGERVSFRVDRCEQRSRSRTCWGSYTLAGRDYRDRLLLGGDRARVGGRMPVLVGRPGGDATTTGLGATVEAGLLMVAGVVLAAVSGRRALTAARARKAARTAQPVPTAGAASPEEPPPTWRRSLRQRARVWEGRQES